MLDVLSLAHVDHDFEHTLGAPLGLVVGFVGDEVAAGAEIRSRALIGEMKRWFWGWDYISSVCFLQHVHV